MHHVNIKQRRYWKREQARAHQFKLTMIIGFSKVLINYGGSKALFIPPRVYITARVARFSLFYNNWTIWQLSAAIDSEREPFLVHSFLCITYSLAYFSLHFCAEENFLSGAFNVHFYIFLQDFLFCSYLTFVSYFHCFAWMAFKGYWNLATLVAAIALEKYCALRQRETSGIKVLKWNFTLESITKQRN